MRLQAEVIKEQLSQNPSYQNGDLAHLLHRLVEDSYRLEHELEQILQLARVEREAGLSLRTFDLEQLVKQIIKKEFRPYVGKMEYTVLSSSSEEQSPSQDLDKIVLLDDFALKMILRNLLENTFKYATDKKIKLSFFYEKKFLILQYQDTHLPSNEDIPHYVQLFYTTGKGSGIGLYIIKKLMEQMRGKLKIINQPYLAFQLFFPLTNKRNAIEITT
jgi:signal transduction histidine kinase